MSKKVHFILYTNSVSAHQLPLAREIVKRIGEENFRYVYTGERQYGAQEIDCQEPWIAKASDISSDELETCDILLSGIRDLTLFEGRAKRHLTTYYMSERFFKPWHHLPGKCRLLSPAYCRMLFRLLKLIKEEETFWYLPIGVWAQEDMLSLGAPQEKMVPWGYFVEPTVLPDDAYFYDPSILRVLWIGRMLDWKRIDTVIRAVAAAKRSIQLNLVGDGPEKCALQKLAKRLHCENRVNFCPPVPIEEVREIMRHHDVIICASNEQEGWGAVVSEALAEGVQILGTYEAGASATLLNESNLFHAGDWRHLSDLLDNVEHCVYSTIPEAFTPAGAAEDIVH